MAEHSTSSSELSNSLENEKEQAQNESVEDEGERGNWTGKFDFLMASLSYAVGLGNLWRFPYLCYKNGGGAFLIPYVLMMIFAGMPLFFMELSFGQFAGRGPIDVWQCCPMFTGIGYAMFLVSVFVGIYYNMVIAWALYYTFASFAKDVPWKHCDNYWNTEVCSEPDQFKNCSSINGTWYNQTCWTIEGDGNETYQYYYGMVEKYGRRSASYEYFHNRVLRISGGLDSMGLPQWDLVLTLLLAWVIVFLCLIKGVKSSGKAVYFTALFPYVVLIILLCRSVTLDGAINGIKFYITPQWHLLKKADVWVDAAVQIFFSLGPCWGGLITLASYNRFHDNALRDSVMITLLNCGTSIFAGFVIFAIIGFMADQLSLGIDKVAVKGAGLAFVVYPEVVAQLPISPLWSILFFLMLITLGVGSQLTVVNTVYTTVLDAFSSTLRVGHRPKIVLLVICGTSFLLGLSFTCPGGMYMLQMMDNYSATYTTVLIGIVESIAISYGYGWERFSQDIKLMLGTRPTIWWRIMWMGVTPLILVFILVFTFVDFSRTSYGDVVLPVWVDVLGWLLCITVIAPIPICAVYLAYKQRQGSILQTLKHITSPSSDWAPADKEAAQNYHLRSAPVQLVEMNFQNSQHIVVNPSTQPEQVPLYIAEPDV